MTPWLRCTARLSMASTGEAASDELDWQIMFGVMKLDQDLEWYI